ncbi:hypothetical protein LEP48_17215 [Isoptericola sp. NEAU-Y5]|uniref:Uncharacterized protein n=1 Tax=Isoptericola luteus TaxID=2879484 RepID=A0ABS7ZKM1_9MICO|nr:hypothetical protein [Isoptericola sp. NEAU-Y5]MCA5895072.1 hypothetical protein [Isoptericola sp. NEAU-Y5]
MGDTQWQKLDGDAELVRTKGRKYQEIADAIGRATSTLAAISNDASTTAKSMDAMKTLADDVREDIAKATDRYRYTGDALVTYSSALDSAISQSETAATQIASIEDDLAAARTTANNAQSEVDDLPSDAADGDVDSANSTLATANSRVSNLEGSLSYWQGRWNDAHGDKNSAAQTAKNSIDEVVTGDKVHGLEDGFWDHVGEVASFLYKALKIICDIAGILAIFLSWVPVLGQVLLVLAAIGSIIAIVEGIVKMAREGFSWGALIGVGLGVMGLFGGKAIGTLAKYAKARSVVQTAGRMSNGAARAKFGTALLKSSRKTFAQTNGQRAWEVLKSPFLRSSTDKAVFGLLKNGEGAKAFTTWRGSQFPLPYKDGAARFTLGNDDVADMIAHFGQTGLRIDNVTSTTSAIATVSAVFHQTANLTNNMVKLGTDISGGNGWGIADTGNSVVTQPAGGAWGNISGIPMKVNSWFG